MTNSNLPPVPGSDDVSRLLEHRAQGLTVKEAAGALHISERQAYRLLKQHGSRPGSQERWSPSTAVNEPAEKVAYLFETMIDAHWSLSESGMAWAIHCAREDLESWEVKSFCRLYIAAQGATAAIGERRKLLIDWVLSYWPWENEDERRDLVRRIPVIDGDEMSYMAEVVNYLDHLLPQDGDDSVLRKYVTTSTDFDRMEFFESELKRITEEESERIARTPPGRIATIEVPGNERKRGRPRKRRKR